MKNILLLGSYGQTNLGDDLLMWNYLSFLRDRGYERVYTNAVRPDLVPQVIQQAFPEMHIVETYKTSMPDWIRLLRRADVALYGGGTIYKEMYGSTGRNKHGVTSRMAAFNTLARLLGTKVYNLNIGTGSIKTGLGQTISRWGLGASNYTVFRDQKSYDYATKTLGLPSHKATASTDGLFLNKQWQKVWNDRPLDLSGNPKQIIGLNLLSDIPDWINRQQYLEAARALVNQLLDDGYGVVLIPFQHDFNPRSDLAFMQQEIVPHITRTTGWTLLPKVEIDEIGSVLAQCDALIGMRFHSLLLATAIGTPFVALAYDTKCVRFAEESDYPHLVRLEDFTLPAVQEALANVLADRQNIQNQLQGIAAQNYNEAEACIQKLQF